MGNKKQTNIIETVKYILITILVVGLFVIIILGLALAIEQSKCELYEVAGFEVEVNAIDGCMILYDGEFISVLKLEKALEIQDLKQRLGSLSNGGKK